MSFLTSGILNASLAMVLARVLLLPLNHNLSHGVNVVARIRLAWLGLVQLLVPKAMLVIKFLIGTPIVFPVLI